MKRFRMPASAPALSLSLSPLSSLTCMRMAARPSPDARSGASRRGNSVASVTAEVKGGGVGWVQRQVRCAVGTLSRAYCSKPHPNPPRQCHNSKQPCSSRPAASNPRRPACDCSNDGDAATPVPQGCRDLGAHETDGGSDSQRRSAVQYSHCPAVLLCIVLRGCRYLLLLLLLPAGQAALCCSRRFPLQLRRPLCRLPLSLLLCRCRVCYSLWGAVPGAGSRCQGTLCPIVE